MKKKQILIIIFLLLLASLLILYFYWPHSPVAEPLLNNYSEQKAAPVFMTAEEKASFFIPADKKVQVIRRDSQGEILTYKIIQNSEEVVNPKSLFPRQANEIK